MKKAKHHLAQPPSPQQQRKRIVVFRLGIATLLFLFTLLLFAATTLTSPILSSYILPTSITASITRSLFVESKLHSLPIPPTSDSVPPRLAYLISGSKGDAQALTRTLLALYHPRNRYVVHLDREASEQERRELRRNLTAHALFMRFGNVRIISKANLITYRGPTMVSNTLHAAAIALREWSDWDWFINLSASDYPLVTQDDMLHVFSTLSRNVNFVDHTSDLGWKDQYRARPLMIDPGLYMSKKQELFFITQKRSGPTQFKLFTGSAWMVLSRSFIDYMIWGWDTLPRTLLMYYTNFVSSPEGYFHTLICNAKEFRNSTVNSDLHFIAWDNPPKQHPLYLMLDDFEKIVSSNAPFARKFPRNGTALLDKIDSELLSKDGAERAVPGGWCLGSRENGTDPCSVIGKTTTLRPGPGSKRLETLISSLLSEENYRPKQCV
ncbi:Beta-glucuronosyltransferase GlcAT14A, variant 2 [Stylosanthes scabra]|uniref:Beta-glucuronosyltransferase GlcAT14A, variant 2 n=2 Tax=Stylosanthes scabra TaxID=79078 RepID=A0ABU6T7Q2_9FABA|nr:Beta-glucuronosyltransferase GlcAT14A, variant 2 [Stylosanthes scabra]